MNTIKKKTPKHYLLYAGLLFFLAGCAVSSKVLEEPKHAADRFYVRHTAYSLVYNENNEQADWVAYKLEKHELEPNFKRNDQFKEDALVYTGTATNKDYQYQGFDKGHLAPAGDMVWNKKALDESFYFSNISPQLPSFNRGIWKKLEDQVRKWARKYDELYIVTGPVCSNRDHTIGENKVVVPTYFFKVILVYNDSVKQGIGFIFPHEKCTNDLFDYAMPIDEVERFTGFDFYYRLPNPQEKKIEKTIDRSYWN